MDNPEKLATQGTQDEETVNTGYTRRRKTKQKQSRETWQHRVHKTTKNKNTTQCLGYHYRHKQTQIT
jgi:hypothetical protein